MNQVNLHERAVSYGYAVAGGSLERGHIQDAYEKGETDQREIDIQQACEWLKANRFAYDQTSDNQFSDMLQQLVKAMKGE